MISAGNRCRGYVAGSCLMQQDLSLPLKHQRDPPVKCSRPRTIQGPSPYGFCDRFPGRIGAERMNRMDAIRHKPGKGSAAKPAAKKSAPGTSGASRARLAARITAERRAVAEMAAKIRERSKEMAAGADRLLSRVS